MLLQVKFIPPACTCTCTCTPDQLSTADEVAYRLLHCACTCTREPLHHSLSAGVIQHPPGARHCYVVPGGMKLEQFLRAYPFAVQTDRWVVTTKGVYSLKPACTGPRSDGGACESCSPLGSDPGMLRLLERATTNPNGTHLSQLGIGKLADRCRQLVVQLKERRKNTLNTLRNCATLDRQVSVYKQLVAAIASPDAPPRVGRVLEQLVHRGKSLSYILDVLTGAVAYCPTYSQNEKQMALLYLKLGGSGLIFASNQARVSCSSDTASRAIEVGHVKYGTTITADEICERLPSDIEYCGWTLAIDEVAAEGCIRPQVCKHQQGSFKLLGFCVKHAGDSVTVNSEANLLALQQRLLDGEIHRITVATVVVLVPHSKRYYSGIPILLFGSCNRFTADFMSRMIGGICDVWCESELPRVCGHIMGIGADGDSRRALAHARAVNNEMTMAVWLTGVDYELAAWGALNVDPPHLVKRLRYALLVTSMLMLTGKKVNAALIRHLGNTLELRFRDSAYNAKDKQHVGYAMEVLQNVGRIVVAMDADEAPHDPTRTVLPDLRILSHIFT